MKAYLVHKSRVFTLNTFPTKLGRNLDNHLVLSNSAVSRYHAEIFMEDDNFYLRDLESTSGTYINDVEIDRPMVLVPGDTIMLADVKLSFYTDLEHLDSTTKQRTTNLEEGTKLDSEEHPED